MRPLFALILLLSLSGCSTAPNHATWYNPATWFTRSALDASQRLEKKETVQENQSLHAAQVENEKTRAVVATLPESRQKDLATRFSGNVSGLLGGVLGQVSMQDQAEVTAIVAGLMSENVKIRAEAEIKQRDAEDRLTQLNNQLIETRRKLDLMQQRQEEEAGKNAALANELKNQRWWRWFWTIAGGSLALVTIVGYTYLRLAFAGKLSLISNAVHTLHKSGYSTEEVEEIASHIRNSAPGFLDKHL